MYGVWWAQTQYILLSLGVSCKEMWLHIIKKLTGGMSNYPQLAQINELSRFIKFEKNCVSYIPINDENGGTFNHFSV